MVFCVVRPEMAMDFGSQKVEPMVDEEAVHGHPTYWYGDVKQSGLMFRLKICPCVLLACY